MTVSKYFYVMISNKINNIIQKTFIYLKKQNVKYLKKINLKYIKNIL